jgi:hypothetical protein
VIEIYGSPEPVPPQSTSLAFGRKEGRNERREEGRKEGIDYRLMLLKNWSHRHYSRCDGE